MENSIGIEGKVRKRLRIKHEKNKLKKEKIKQFLVNLVSPS